MSDHPLFPFSLFKRHVTVSMVGVDSNLTPDCLLFLLCETDPCRRSFIADLTYHLTLSILTLLLFPPRQTSLTSTSPCLRPSVSVVPFVTLVTHKFKSMWGPEDTSEFPIIYCRPSPSPRTRKDSSRLKQDLLHNSLMTS